jgi:hypothetical protein
MKHEPGRGTGRTSRAMSNAPAGAIYVIAHQSTAHYYLELSRHLGRGDLKIHTPMTLERDGIKLRGLIYDVIVDHACMLNGEQIEILRQHWQRIDYRRKS